MLWDLFFRAGYRLLRLLDPILRWLWRHRIALRRSVDVVVRGRRTGRPRRVLLTLLTVGDAIYIGHPNGIAPWTRNVDAAGTVDLIDVDGQRRSFRPVRLWAGPEREAVIRATWSQQPFPANVAYTLAWDHVRRVGVYFRLVPVREGVEG